MMSQGLKEQYGDQRVSPRNPTLKRVVMSMDIATRREILKPDWDKAVELAYVGEKARKIAALPVSQEATEQTLALMEEISHIGEQYKVRNRQYYRGRPVNYKSVPHHYTALEDLVAWHYYDRQAGQDSAETGSQMVEGFMQAVSDLIGPDFYIEGMNPYEDAPRID